MKLGDRAVIYRHGSVGEKDEYFGISKYEGDFFEEAVRNGVIRWIFCGHDHLNTLSLEYKGIRMTYGMSNRLSGIPRYPQKPDSTRRNADYASRGRQCGDSDASAGQRGIAACEEGKKEMKLLFKQRFFSWFDSYDIYDESGATRYVVKGQLSWGHRPQDF